MLRQLTLKIGLALTLALTLKFAHAQETNYQGLFWQQIANSCMTPVRWEKSVQKVEEGTPGEKETHTYKIDCRKGTATNEASGNSSTLRFSEFSTLFEYTYRNPYLAEYLDIKRDGQSLDATVKPGSEADCKLHRQHFQVDDSTGNITYAEAQIVKNAVLYDMEITIKVWFDEKGRYQKHRTDTYTSVALAGGIRTIIQSQRLN